MTFEKRLERLEERRDQSLTATREQAELEATRAALARLSVVELQALERAIERRERGDPETPADRGALSVWDRATADE